MRQRRRQFLLIVQPADERIGDVHMLATGRDHVGNAVMDDVETDLLGEGPFAALGKMRRRADVLLMQLISGGKQALAHALDVIVQGSIPGDIRRKGLMNGLGVVYGGQVAGAGGRAAGAAQRQQGRKYERGNEDATRRHDLLPCNIPDGKGRGQ
jgi:hypothetical protein